MFVSVLRSIAIVASLIAAEGAFAAEGGELGNLLKTTITAIQGGKPDYAKMEPLTAAAVEQQMGMMRPILQQLGAVQSATFMGIQSMPGGSGEAYRVRFANGSMMWVISESPAGKIQILWTSGVEGSAPSSR